MKTIQTKIQIKRIGYGPYLQHVMGYYNVKNGYKLNLRYFILLLLIIPVLSIGQESRDSLLAAFYNKTLMYYFSDLEKQEDLTKYKTVILKTNFDINKLPETACNYKLSYFNDSVSIFELLNRPIRRNRNRLIYWINHEIISPDTIDIIIGGWTIEKVNKKEISLAAWCGGDMGYVPDGRFINNKVSHRWEFITKQEIINQRINDYKELLEKNNSP